MNANEVKNNILNYFRFKRGFIYVATELWNEDVVVSDGVNLIAIEVKVSWSDYIREFKKEKYKPHYRSFGYHYSNPKRKFFAAPNELASRISSDLNKSFLGAGVISVDSKGNVSVLRRAKDLHLQEINSEAIKDITARATSELVNVRKIVRN